MKIKIFLVVFFCFLINVAAVNSQVEYQCATRPTKIEMKRAKELAKELRNRTPQAYEDNTIKVIMYRFRHDNGSGAKSDSAFAAEINSLNSSYVGHGICFSLLRILNVDNSAIMNTDWGNDPTVDSLFNIIPTEYPAFNDAITIYVAPGYPGGKAYGIPSTAFIMSDAWFGLPLTAHEMGHCFGNLHTHDDSGGAHMELHTRFCPILPIPNDLGLWFDCCTGADGLCDTQADPNLGDTTSYGMARVDLATCTYIDTTWTDPFGNLLTPDVSNIMSYAPLQCTSTFSDAQKTIQHVNLDVSLLFPNVQAPFALDLNGLTIHTGYKHEMAKNTIKVSAINNYVIKGSAEVIHQAEDFIELKDGFVAQPTVNSGFYLARVKDLCNNDTSLDYQINN